MNQIPFTAKDFTSDQEVRWCPGCGDYAILKAVRAVLAELGRPPHEVVFVSGIGCAARFPYYLATYGFHTIHGRAPAVATGLKLANPELDVWVVGGDGDFLSIGGNHLIHALRRNVDLNLLLFNNAIYGLTKGQYSPTSPIGTRSPSSPDGSVDRPVDAARLALGAGARFVARTADTLQDHLPDILKRANAHCGASFVEIFQNCIVYADGAFGAIADKKAGPEIVVRVVHDEPMIYGKEKDKGLRFNESTGAFEAVPLTSEADLSAIARHDEKDALRAMALVNMSGPDLPTALGVLYCDPAESFTAAREEKHQRASLSRDDLQALISKG